MFGDSVRMGNTRHLISVEDLSDRDLAYMVARGVRYAQLGTAGERALADTVVGVYFGKTSTRTRTAFSSGALRLGGQIVTYGPGDLQLNTGESMADTGRVLSAMLDVLVVRTAGDEQERHDMDDLPPDLHVVYTTRWQTTGTTKPDPNWREAFLPFRVHSGLWERSKDALFLHDLPAHRGEEVTAEVLDGPRSAAFEQAATKLHSAMAVLDWCVNGVPDGPWKGNGERPRAH